MKTFIIADLKLFDVELVSLLGYDDFDQFHREVISSWNATVKPEDKVIIMGDLIGDNGDAEPITVDELAAVVNKLNGELLLTSKEAKTLFTAEEWEKIGIAHVWSVPLFKTFENGDEIYYPIQQIKVMNVYEEQYKVLVVDHNNPIEGMVKGIMLSAEACKWSYSPLNTDDIITIYNNMKEFEEMEDGEEHRSDVKEEGEE